MRRLPLFAFVLAAALAPSVRAQDIDPALVGAWQLVEVRRADGRVTPDLDGMRVRFVFTADGALIVSTQRGDAEPRADTSTFSTADGMLRVGFDPEHPGAYTFEEGAFVMAMVRRTRATASVGGGTPTETVTETTDHLVFRREEEVEE